MVKRFAPTLCLALTVCKGGLHTDKGNDFPCDFSQAVATRDGACTKGDVCGVDNVCRPYRYEGPQFEGGASEPRFNITALRHPLVLSEPIRAVTRATGDNFTDVWVVSGKTSDAQSTRLYLSNSVAVEKPSYRLNADELTAIALAPSDDLLDKSFVPLAITREGMNDVALLPRADGGRLVAPLTNADRLRTGSNRAAVVRLEPEGSTLTDAGAFELRPLGLFPLDFDAVETDGGSHLVRVLDARFLPKVGVGPDEVLVLSSDALYLKRAATPLRLSSTNETFSDSLRSARPPRTELRTDSSGTVAAFSIATKDSAKVLSSWRLDRGVTPSAVKLWSDCSPCLNGRIASFAPTFESGVPVVEVLCAQSSSNDAKNTLLSLITVTGSQAADENQLCTVKALEAPFPLKQVNVVSAGRKAAEGGAPSVVADDATGRNVSLGGKRGQVWLGPSFSQALPLFLERTPAAFGSLPRLDGGSVPAVITDRYVAAPFQSDVGYTVLDIRASSLLRDDVQVAAFINQALGWGVFSSGDIFTIDLSTNAKVRVAFGPRLLDARGNAAVGPFVGEAVKSSDGGVLSYVLTADDSLYFSAAPTLDALTPTPNVLAPLSPQLTPAPSSPIRSFVLERSALGTNGVDRVRGYLIAGRQLFLVTLDGTPARWVATPLVLQGGEPVEVWMDHPLGGLGRVGFRDGQVFTLPGGFLLVNQLPLDSGPNPPIVLDYENLGGWPVAMTSNGLFEAHYEVLENGRLDNRFPDGGINRAMDWQRVTLPDGGEPWLDRPAKLQVTQESIAYDPNSGLLRANPDGTFPARARMFRLLVYTDEQVYEVGSLVRR